MAQEIEIKLKIADVSEFLSKLKRLQAGHLSKYAGRVHEVNEIFDTAAGILKKRGQLLRIRTETPAGPGKRRARQKKVTLTFKRPARREPGTGGSGPHKVREEIESQLADGPALAKIFQALGMHPVFRYEKYRTTFQFPRAQRWAAGLLIELDETPIGKFVELEGPPGAIDRAAKALGFSRADYITTNYLVLYREACRHRKKKPQDMLFQENLKKN